MHSCFQRSTRSPGKPIPHFGFVADCGGRYVIHGFCLAPLPNCHRLWIRRMAAVTTMVVAMTVAVAMMVEAARSRRVLRHNADKVRGQSRLAGLPRYSIS
jgi:hypothetical protein